ncbi:MAG: DUF1640 domain-containing protein [Actinobacteria bacterium]|nr:DUF1640 domain-containing protein [Actinomycetota bacterium]
MINDADRRNLYAALSEAIGPKPSDLLMELLPPTGWAHLATQQDITAVRADITTVRADMTAVRADIDIVRADIDIAKTELRIEMSDLRTELKAEIHGVRTEVQDLRIELKADIQDVKSEIQDVKNMFPKLITANIASMIGTAGLVLGAVAIG